MEGKQRFLVSLYFLLRFSLVQLPCHTEKATVEILDPLEQDSAQQTPDSET